jgi:hypothetical protein
MKRSGRARSSRLREREEIPLGPPFSKGEDAELEAAEAVALKRAAWP